MVDLRGRGGGKSRKQAEEKKKETPGINPRGLILSDNLRKPQRHSEEITHLTKDFQVPGGGHLGSSCAVELIEDLNSLLTWPRWTKC